jgi:hypothetical protein
MVFFKPSIFENGGAGVFWGAKGVLTSGARKDDSKERLV